jgi:hypothetical protein
MIESFAKMAITKDLTGDILKSLNELADKNVYVGVPEEENAHEGKSVHEDITDAQLLYIHTHGIRNQDMIKEMQHDIDHGMPYSQAHELYVHEHGSPLWQSPPRPVLEPSINNSKEIISEQMKKAAGSALDGGEITTELNKVGMLGQNVARAWFTNPDNKWEPNTAGTIKRKGSDKPLIDTGELRKSITYIVKEGGHE